MTNAKTKIKVGVVGVVRVVGIFGVVKVVRVTGLTWVVRVMVRVQAPRILK